MALTATDIIKHNATFIVDLNALNVSEGGIIHSEESTLPPSSLCMSSNMPMIG